MWQQLCEVCAKTIIHLSVGQQYKYLSHRER